MRENKGRSIIDLPSEYVVIDTETTGLDFEFCNLIEVSALRYADGQCVGSYSSLVNPGCPVDSFITDLTGITNEMLEVAPEPLPRSSNKRKQVFYA